MSKKKQISKKTVNDNEGSFVILAAIVLLVAVLVFFTFTPINNERGGGDVEWEIDETGTELKINCSGDMDNYSKDNKAPWSEYCDTVAQVKLSDKITSIGDHAFDNFVKLEKINIPSNVKRIGYGAFFNSKALGSINIPSSVETIDDSAFSKCTNLKVVDWEDQKTLRKIGDYAFFQCTNLQGFEFMKFASLQTIGNYAFDHCENATFILDNMPDSIAIIGKSAFYQVKLSGLITFGSGLKQICDEAFKRCNSIINVDMSKCQGVVLGKGIFSNCDALVNVTLFNGITEIPDYMFRSCENLVSVSVPSSNDVGDVDLTGISLGTEAFYYCYNLADGKTLTIGGDGVKIGEKCFGGKCGMDAQYIIVKTDVNAYSFDLVTFYDKTPEQMDTINGEFSRADSNTYELQ